MTTKIVLIFLFIIRSVYCEEHNSLSGNATNVLDFSESLKNQLNKGLLEGHAEHIVRSVQEGCEKNGGPNAFGAVRVAFEEMTLCLDSTIREVQIPMYGNDSMNDPIKRLCAKVPFIRHCINKMVLVLQPCLTARESRDLDESEKSLHEMLAFACHNEGQRVKEFVADGGLACLGSQQYSAQMCVSVTTTLQNSTATDNVIDELFEKKNCASIVDFRYCVRYMFRQCNLTKPSNFFDSLFDIMLRRMRCNDQLLSFADNDLQPNASGRSSPSGAHCPSTEPSPPGLAPTVSAGTTPKQADKMKPKDARPEFFDCRELSEFDATGISVSKKLARMDPLQAIYAESLIHAILRGGLLKEIRDDTNFCTIGSTKPRRYL